MSTRTSRKDKPVVQRKVKKKLVAESIIDTPTSVPTPITPSVITSSSSNASTTTVDVPLPQDPDFIPFVVGIPNSASSVNVFDVKPEIILSQNIAYPEFSLGFHYIIPQNKQKMEILREFEEKKKVYLVMNRFERYIDNYPDDIGHFGLQYFDITGDKPNILSRGFYKLWEILFMFDLIGLKQKNFVSAHLAEGPGSFIQATMFFRDKFADDSSHDKYYAVTLHSEDDGKHIPELEKTFTDYYEREKPRRFMLHQTYPKQVAGAHDMKDNGDITDPKTINLFGGQMGKERADFITADGGFDWANENTQEQEAFRLIFAQIFTALTIQKQGGHFVCKFFETFTDTSLKFIYLLGQMYNQVYFCKPLTSRPSNSEKYVVCLDFKFAEKDKQYVGIIKKLTEIIDQLHEKRDVNWVSIWPELVLPTEFLSTIIFCNTSIANRQLKGINEIVSFIKEQNYYGDVYQMRRQMQIDAAKYWISRFMPSEEEFPDVIRAVRQETDLIVDKYSDPKLLPKIDFS